MDFLFFHRPLAHAFPTSSIASAMAPSYCGTYSGNGTTVSSLSQAQKRALDEPLELPPCVDRGAPHTCYVSLTSRLRISTQGRLQLVGAKAKCTLSSSHAAAGMDYQIDVLLIPRPPKDLPQDAIGKPRMSQSAVLCTIETWPFFVGTILVELRFRHAPNNRASLAHDIAVAGSVVVFVKGAVPNEPTIPSASRPASIVTPKLPATFFTNALQSVINTRVIVVVCNETQ